MTATHVTPYTNELGQTRYQPTLPSGERLWHAIAANILYWSLSAQSDIYRKAVPHKRAAKAQRVAEREELRRRSVFREA